MKGVNGMIECESCWSHKTEWIDNKTVKCLECGEITEVKNVGEAEPRCPSCHGLSVWTRSEKDVSNGHKKYKCTTCRYEWD